MSGTSLDTLHMVALLKITRPEVGTLNLIVFRWEKRMCGRVSDSSKAHG